MKDVVDFLSAALPWISMGLLLAVFFAQTARKRQSNNKNEDYGTRGLGLGMMFGAAVGAAVDHTGIGLTLGMLTGLVIGSCIEKKNNDNEEREKNSTKSEFGGKT